MCELFVGADRTLWSSKTRSLRIDGVVTSVRLEHFFWQVLEEIGVRDAMTVNQLIARLYLESIDAGHDMGNFSSFLRVCCGRYLSLAADGSLVRESSQPLALVDSKRLLSDERNQIQRRKVVLLEARPETRWDLN
ncbi:ribbon-helix-helix domain-containing protein [Aestuariirhabdus sp. Z084]|uniref:ribbon-helix-helix domain-containing protein n=1 Tax=Aestuariirhabdus haliotis TaxID=2918751 RepID=UPI00201B3EB1|nr:ribbon-helix-helix domain-containing protein [Aestuariirhabdus haliotis]MCL6417669.1 ribbon-helix-helix domain-containing protein [Aestuariirhabdus haliotis]MCL6421604.1 ribbon-helix-helix domain-containing protein [Aestuariirhabdus haliotis]